MNKTSLVDLKAILSEKKKEAARLFGEQNVKLKGGGNKWKSLAKQLELKNKVKELRLNSEKEVDKEKKKEIEEEIERALRLSREMLEKKSKLYEEKMNKALNGIFESDEEDECQDLDEDKEGLVNFDQKALMEIRKIRAQETEQRLREEKRKLSDEEDDNDWVEFTDSLQRTRKCLRKDLKYYMEQDYNMCKKLNLNANKNLKEEFNKEDGSNEEDLGYEDGSIHYQKVRNNEVRDHGVGYYQFSVDKEERRIQMEELTKLREQTEKQRALKLKMKEKKQNLLNQRLAKIAARRGITLDTAQLNESDDKNE